MVKNYLSIFLALSARSPSSEAFYSARKSTFDGEGARVTTNIAAATNYRVEHPDIGDLDAGTDNTSTGVNACEEGQYLDVTAQDHPGIDGCYALQEVTPLHEPAGFQQYERVPCGHGGGGSVGGMRVVRVEPPNMMDVRVP